MEKNKFSQICIYILNETWFPILVFLFEILVISVIIFLITNFIPHDFEILKGYGVLSWMVLISCIRFATYKLQAKDDIEEALRSNDENDQNIDEPISPIMERIIKDPDSTNNTSPRNIYDAGNTGGSVRE